MYFNARYYDPYLNQWIQPDTIVPDAGNLLDYNRFLYARANPLKYVDPSGHDPLDSAWRENFAQIFGREPEWYDEVLHLFKIAYPGEWNANLFYNADGTWKGAEAIVSIFRTPPESRSWDTLGEALVRLSQHYTEDEEAMFVQDVAFLYAGLRARSQDRWYSRAYWSRGAWPGNEHLYVARGSLSEEYFVRPNRGFDPDYNVHHWAWTFAMGYNMRPAIATSVNDFREFQQGGYRRNNVDTSDVRIGNVGIQMGHALSTDQTSPIDIPSLLQRQLGVGP